MEERRGMTYVYGVKVISRKASMIAAMPREASERRTPSKALRKSPLRCA